MNYVTEMIVGGGFVAMGVMLLLMRAWVRNLEEALREQMKLHGHAIDRWRDKFYDLHEELESGFEAAGLVHERAETRRARWVKPAPKVCDVGPAKPEPASSQVTRTRARSRK